MLGWLKGLFSTPKLAEAAGDVIKGAVNGIDKLFYTDEEKAENAQKAFELWLKAQNILIHESSVRSMTRRYLAIMIVGVFLFLILFAAILFAFGVTTAKEVFACAKAISGLTLMVTGFYFTYYGIQQTVAAVKKKKED